MYSGVLTPPLIFLKREPMAHFKMLRESSLFTYYKDNLFVPVQIKGK